MTLKQFAEKQAQMSDKELIDLVEKAIYKMCETGGRSFVMCVPPCLNDLDMLLSELLRRYKKKADFFKKTGVLKN